MNDLLSTICENIEHKYSDCSISSISNEDNSIVIYLTDIEDIYKSITVTEIEPNKYSIKMEYIPDNIKGFTKIVEKENIGSFLRKITTLLY
jgi:hypothetical protein